MKTKRFTKSIVVAIALLLIVALGFGLTGAWYRARRGATGTMKFDKGIVIQYSGFDNEITPAEDWAPNANAVRLFTSESMLPGSTVAFDDAQINQKSGTTPFFARVKLVFDFYSTADDPATENVDESVLISPASLTAANFNVSDLLTEGADGIFTNVWTESGDGWFYYTGAGETITQFPTTATDIFVTTGVGAQYIIAGDTFGPALPANYQEGGAFKVSNDISIAQFKITLIIDTLQADATPADCGWAITTSENPAAMSAAFLQNWKVCYSQDGPDVSGMNSPLEGQGLIVDRTTGRGYVYELNGTDIWISHSFNNPINVEIPKYLVINETIYTTKAIIENAFVDCTSLINITIPDSVVQIGSLAFSGCTGLTSISIPSSVGYLDGASFAGCTNLSTIYIDSAGIAMCLTGADEFTCGGILANATDVYLKSGISATSYITENFTNVGTANGYVHYQKNI